MTVRQYTGLRYIPLFDGNWDVTKTYEALTVVTYRGDSYISKQSVPVGTDISNTSYWAVSGNYNAQIEAYRRDVVEVADGLTDEIEDREDADETLQSNIDAEALARGNADTTERNERIAADAAKQDKKDYIAIIGDSFSTSSPSFSYWHEYVAMDTGKTIINKATNGSGFTIGPKTFSQQLAEVISDANFAKVSDIIVYGGFNDFNSGATNVQTLNAIDTFMSNFNAISGVKPRLIFCFCNCGYAQTSAYNGFFEWYTGIIQILQSRGYAGIVDNVPYWHFAAPSMFINDNLHPNADGQKTIAGFMLKLLAGSYDGVHRVQWYDTWSYSGATYGCRKVISFDNGQVGLTVRTNQQVPNVSLTTNQFVDLGDITNSASQFSIMFGDDTSALLAAWVYSQTVAEAISDNDDIGILRYMFNIANKHVYLQCFGNADAFSGNAYTIPYNEQAIFDTIKPTRW